MILQYEGHNNSYGKNWCYTEADTIIYTFINVGSVVKEINAKYTPLLNQHLGQTVETNELNYRRMTELKVEMDSYIFRETNCDLNNIEYISSYSPDQFTRVCIVQLMRKDNPVTYVFYELDAYLLNNSGKTIQRLR